MLDHPCCLRLLTCTCGGTTASLREPKGRRDRVGEIGVGGIASTSRPRQWHEPQNHSDTAPRLQRTPGARLLMHPRCAGGRAFGGVGLETRRIGGLHSSMRSSPRCRWRMEDRRLRMGMEFIHAFIHYSWHAVKFGPVSSGHVPLQLRPARDAALGWWPGTHSTPGTRKFHRARCRGPLR